METLLTNRAVNIETHNSSSTVCRRPPPRAAASATDVTAADAAAAALLLDAERKWRARSGHRTRLRSKQVGVRFEGNRKHAQIRSTATSGKSPQSRRRISSAGLDFCRRRCRAAPRTSLNTHTRSLARSPLLRSLSFSHTRPSNHPSLRSRQTYAMYNSQHDYSDKVAPQFH